VIVQIWAEAIRDPEMAAIARELLGLLTDRIETLLAPRTGTSSSRSMRGPELPLACVLQINRIGQSPQPLATFRSRCCSTSGTVRLSRRVEVAAHDVLSEALASTAKHAEVSGVLLRGRGG
jgi:hypothetical protein